MCSCPYNTKAAVLVTIEQNVRQIVVHDKFQKIIAGRGMRPAILVTMLHAEAVTLCTLLESAVVIGVPSAAILYTIFVIVVMYHLMQQCGCDLLYRA